jgi:hypothetical protein
MNLILYQHDDVIEVSFVYYCIQCSYGSSLQEIALESIILACFYNLNTVNSLQRVISEKN